MISPRLEVDLDKIAHNARELVASAAKRNITITAVTKAMLGSPELARALTDAGIAGLGDSRIENIERMRQAGIDEPMLLLRSPMLSQIERVVSAQTMSVNTEPEVLSALAGAARVSGQVHDVMLMVELGDLREGVMPAQLAETARHVLAQPTLRLRGIGTNLACRNGVEPSPENMGQLSSLVNSVEADLGVEIEVVSGGNSANLDWALGQSALGQTALGQSALGRINNLRLGEAVLLGREPLRRCPVPGLHTDAFVLTAEVIESKRKPSKPWGQMALNSFGETPQVEDRGVIWQTILAIGRQDIDPTDLTPPEGVDVLSASSDHLVVETPHRMRPGDELRFEPGYSSLLRSMTSPYVAKQLGVVHSFSG